MILPIHRSCPYASAVIKAWRSKHIGQAHNALLNAIDHTHTFRGKAIYNYAKVCQSPSLQGLGNLEL